MLAVLMLFLSPVPGVSSGGGVGTGNTPSPLLSVPTTPNANLVANLVKEHILTSTTSMAAQAMLAVDRTYFTPSDSPAYEDTPQSIGHGATISAPHMHAHALEEVTPCLEQAKQRLAGDASDVLRVLDVGSGTGYLTACLAHMAGKLARVVGIEHVEKLTDAARENLRRAGFSNWLETNRIVLVTGDGRLGYPPEAPYDVIHVGAAASSVPKALLNQLRPLGCMFIPVGPAHHQAIYMYVKDADGRVSSKRLLNVRYVPLTDLAQQIG